MIINRDDLCDCSTLVYKQLQQLSDSAQAYREEANRINEVNRMLSYLIVEGKITDSEDIDCAIALLNHTDLSPIGIINKILS